MKSCPTDPAVIPYDARPRLNTAGKRRVLPCLLVLVLGAGPAGCAVVRPWQRDVLARRVMQLERDPTEVRLREGLLSYREGSTGGLGSKGGGCGCD
jgi:Domain of unknown function (DUF4266)